MTGKEKMEFKGGNYKGRNTELFFSQKVKWLIKSSNAI